MAKSIVFCCSFCACICCWPSKKSFWGINPQVYCNWNNKTAFSNFIWGGVEIRWEGIIKQYLMWIMFVWKSQTIFQQGESGTSFFWILNYLWLQVLFWCQIFLEIFKLFLKCILLHFAHFYTYSIKKYLLFNAKNQFSIYFLLLFDMYI